MPATRTHQLRRGRARFSVRKRRHNLSWKVQREPFAWDRTVSTGIAKQIANARGVPSMLVASGPLLLMKSTLLCPQNGVRTDTHYRC